METKQNDKKPKLSLAFHDAAKIRQAKESDYSGIKEYFPYGDMSFTQMIHVKSTRLVHLVVQKGIKPTNESIEDNLLDLINYASYYYEWRKGELNE